MFFKSIYLIEPIAYASYTAATIISYAILISSLIEKRRRGYEPNKNLYLYLCEIIVCIIIAVSPLNMYIVFSKIRTYYRVQRLIFLEKKLWANLWDILNSPIKQILKPRKKSEDVCCSDHEWYKQTNGNEKSIW